MLYVGPSLGSPLTPSLSAMWASCFLLPFQPFNFLFLINLSRHRTYFLVNNKVCEHQQRCSQHACRALIHDRSQCPTPLRAGLLGPRVVSPHPQGLQGSHLNLSHRPAQKRHRTYFLSVCGSYVHSRRRTLLRQR